MKLSEAAKEEKTEQKEVRKLKISPGAIIIIAVFILVLITAVILIQDQRYVMDTPAVILPSSIGSEDSSSAQDFEVDDTLNRAVVTVDTVQAVMGTLIRAESYSRSVTVERFWDEESSLSTIEAWVKGTSTRISVTGETETKNILVLDSDIWIWYSENGSYYHGETDGGYTEVDQYQKILSYEDLLNLNSSDILDAGYTDYNGEPCVYAKYISGQLGYLSSIYVSVDSGLLMGAETYDGGTLVYRMVSDAPNISTPSDDIFALPE